MQTELIRELQALNSRAVVDLNLSVNQYDIGELSILHTEVGRLIEVLKQSRAVITKQIYEVREAQRAQLPLEQQHENQIPAMMREMRDQLFKEWEDSQTPPLLRKDNLLPGMQYSVPRLMRQILSAMFEPTIGKDITVQAVNYDLQGPDPTKVLSFRFSVNTLKGLKTSMCVFDAPALFAAVRRAETILDTSVLEEAVVKISLDPTKEPQDVTVRKRKSKTKPKTKTVDGKTVVKKTKTEREAEESALLAEKYKRLGF